MDPHAYTLLELRNRISPSLQQLFDETTNQIQVNLHPVFFIIDSVGGGDQDYNDFLGSYVDRLNSIFSSISTVCVSINTPNNNNVETADYLRMIRKGQMLSDFEFIPEVILGLRDLPNDIISQLNRQKHASYQNGMKKLNDEWFEEDDHQMIRSQYEKNSLFVMPISDPNKAIDSYMFSVSEVLLKIVHSTVYKINQIRSSNLKNIQNISRRLSNYLFQPEYEQILKSLNRELSKPYDAEKLCNFFCEICRGQITSRIKIGEKENPNKDEILIEINQLLTFIEVNTSIYLPIFLADTNIPFNEVVQLIYDLYTESYFYIKKAFRKKTIVLYLFNL